MTKSDKTRLWPIQQVGPVRDRPAHHGDNLYVATMGQSLYCFDLNTGSRRWRRRMAASLSEAPQATGESVYQPVPGSGVDRLDPASGRVRWDVPEGMDLLAEHASLVWLMSNRYSLLGCSRKDGKILHEIPCRADLWIANTVDDAIFIGTAEGHLACIRPADAGFLNYKTYVRSAAGLPTSPSSQPADEGTARPKRPARVDYLRDNSSIPPVAGNATTPAQPQ